MYKDVLKDEELESFYHIYSKVFRGKYKLSREETLSEWFCLPSEKGVFSKRKEFAPFGEQILSIQSRPCNRMDLVCREAKTKL